MDRDSLRQVLDANRVDPASYSLDGGLRDEGYILEPDAEGWSVYYAERGLRSGETRFDDESSACTYLLELLLRDSTTRLPG